jgi:flagellar basal-body rod protein FlgB
MEGYRMGIYDQLKVNSINFALDTLSEKSVQIARNIANADTPLYRSKKLEFKEVMTDYFSAARPDKLYVTNQKHMQVYSESVEPVNYVRRQNNPSLRTDGNDVNMEYETSEQAATTMMFDLFTNIVGGKFATMKDVIRGRSA